jgi:hypothetical protein
MAITQISAWIMLVSCGLWAGGILIFAVERTNLSTAARARMAMVDVAPAMISRNSAASFSAVECQFTCGHSFTFDIHLVLQGFAPVLKACDLNFAKPLRKKWQAEPIEYLPRSSYQSRRHIEPRQRFSETDCYQWLTV